jgi:hemerythrin-like domain-containing protein
MKKQSKKKTLTKATDASDITELMLRDHKPLKRCIKTMKSEDAELSKVRSAFEEFAPLLEAHAVPEQDSLYNWMKDDVKEMRVEGFEGFTEHAIADKLAKEIKSTTDKDEFRAKVKVLAELVEHHIEEEEEDMIPDIRKDFSLDERVEIGQEYLALRARYGIAEEAA